MYPIQYKQIKGFVSDGIMRNYTTWRDDALMIDAKELEYILDYAKTVAKAKKEGYPLPYPDEHKEELERRMREWGTREGADNTPTDTSTPHNSDG